MTIIQVHRQVENMGSTHTASAEREPIYSGGWGGQRQREIKGI